MHSQDIPPKNEVNIPVETEQDTLNPSILNVTREVNEAITDTVKTDTIKPKKEQLTNLKNKR